MTPEDMKQVRPQLKRWQPTCWGLARADQRAKGELYLRGLMLDGKRKSMQPMAERLEVDHQQLQQFVTSSTWDYTDVRHRVARWAGSFVRPEAYVVDDSGFPKDGLDLPERPASTAGALGKTGNCQIGVSVHAVTDWASAAIGWRLFLPASWDHTTTGDSQVVEQIRWRRARCKIPDDVRHREKWRLALDMLDEILAPDTGPDSADGGWGLPRLPVVADAGYGDTTALFPPVSIRPSRSQSSCLTRRVVDVVRFRATGRHPPTHLRVLVLAAGRVDGDDAPQGDEQDGSGASTYLRVGLRQRDHRRGGGSGWFSPAPPNSGFLAF